MRNHECSARIVFSGTRWLEILLERKLMKVLERTKFVRTKLVAALCAATAMSASVAGAQVTAFNTQGFFTSSATGCSGTAALTATCATNGYSLLFTGTTGSNIGSGSTISFGNFMLTSTGTTASSPTSVFFTLVVNQTEPMGGTGNFAGTITGNVTTSTTNGDISHLIWTPNEFVDIPPNMYQLIFDNTGDAAGRGLAIPINNNRGINAIVTTTTTPEPSSVALIGTGLLALVPLVRRRRR